MVYSIEQYFPLYGEWREIGRAVSRCVALQQIFNIKKEFPRTQFRICHIIDTF